MTTILIIDDDPGVRKTMNVMLSRQGFDIIESENGKLAICSLRKKPADLVITDILMPEQDGIETIKILKCMWPDIKIIAISGGGAYLPSHLYLDMADLMGADAILCKPFTSKKLLQSVNDLLDAEIEITIASP